MRAAASWAVSAGTNFLETGAAKFEPDGNAIAGGTQPRRRDCDSPLRVVEPCRFTSRAGCPRQE